MNIFEVLNQGNSKLHEPSISAMLGYLLDTSRDHGLGDIFFREFLKIINKDIGDNRMNYSILSQKGWSFSAKSC